MIHWLSFLLDVAELVQLVLEVASQLLIVISILLLLLLVLAFEVCQHVVKPTQTRHIVWQTDRQTTDTDDIASPASHTCIWGLSAHREAYTDMAHSVIDRWTDRRLTSIRTDGRTTDRWQTISFLLLLVLVFEICQHVLKPRETQTHNVTNRQSDR